MSRKLFDSVTLAFIPHRGGKPIKLQFSFLAMVIGIVFAFITILATTILIIRVPSYFSLKKQICQAKQQIGALKADYARDVGCLKDTLTKLRQTERELRKLLDLNSKEEIIKVVEPKNIPFSGIGSVDIETIKREMEERISSLVELKSYLEKQKSIYLATPKGWPVKKGYISSGFGWRVHPITGKREFHYGVDIAAPLGTPIRATADGMVICTGKKRLSGNYIIIQHGYGFSSVYAHLKKYVVKVGQEVKRGEVIGYVGSTGLSTGPHLYYGICNNKRWINPMAYIRPNKVIKKKRDRKGQICGKSLRQIKK